VRFHVSVDKNVDEGKGRLKEAAGSLTDDDDLKNDGKVDRTKGSRTKLTVLPTRQRPPSTKTGISPRLRIGAGPGR
jgi:hypothetical protein